MGDHVTYFPNQDTFEHERGVINNHFETINNEYVRKQQEVLLGPKERKLEFK